MTDWPADTTVIGDDHDWTPPPYTKAVMAAIDELRAKGFEPVEVVVPGPPPREEPMLRTFYGIPVVHAPGADRVHLVIDVVSVEGRDGTEKVA